jgi:hypothetical protein
MQTNVEDAIAASGTAWIWLLAWRRGHTDGPDWRYFIPWANEQLGLRR